MQNAENQFEQIPIKSEFGNMKMRISKHHKEARKKNSKWSVDENRAITHNNEAFKCHNMIKDDNSSMFDKQNRNLNINEENYPKHQQLVRTQHQPQTKP